MVCNPAGWTRWERDKSRQHKMAGEHQEQEEDRSFPKPNRRGWAGGCVTMPGAGGAAIGGAGVAGYLASGMHAWLCPLKRAAGQKGERKTLRRPKEFASRHKEAGM